MNFHSRMSTGPWFHTYSQSSGRCYFLNCGKKLPSPLEFDCTSKVSFVNECAYFGGVFVTGFFFRFCWSDLDSAFFKKESTKLQASLRCEKKFFIRYTDPIGCKNRSNIWVKVQLNSSWGFLNLQVGIETDTWHKSRPKYYSSSCWQRIWKSTCPSV